MYFLQDLSSACMQACACMLFPCICICLCRWCLMTMLDCLQSSCLHAVYSRVSCKLASVVLCQPSLCSKSASKCTLCNGPQDEILRGPDQHSVLVNQMVSLLASFWVVKDDSMFSSAGSKTCRSPYLLMACQVTHFTFWAAQTWADQIYLQLCCKFFQCHQFTPMQAFFASLQSHVVR